MIKKVMVCLVLFALSAVTVSAVWYEEYFGGEVDVSEPGAPTVTWFYRTFGGYAIVSEPGVTWHALTFGGETEIYGWTDWSDWWNITIPDNQPPTNFTATVNSTTSIDLAWNKYPGSQTTRIVMKKGSAPSSFPDGGVIIYNSTGESYHKSGLDVGTLYGFGAWSWNVENSMTFVNDTEYTLPGNPSSLTNISLGSVGVLLGWTKGTNATHTLIIMNETGYAGFPTDPYNGTEKYNGTASQNTIGGLSPNTTYYFSAFGYIDDLDGYHSPGYATHSCTTLESTDDPQNLVANPYNDTIINLTWSAGAYPTVIIRKEGSYPSNATDGTEIYNNSGFIYNDTGLNPTSHYFYRGWGWNGVSYGVNYTEDNNWTRPGIYNVTTSYDNSNLTISWDNNYTYLSDHFETDFGNWSNSNSWSIDTGQKANGSSSARCSDNNGDLISDTYNTTDAYYINISYWFRDDDSEADDVRLMFWNGASAVKIHDLCSDSEDTWHYFSYSTTSASYHIDDFYFYFDEALDDTGENIWIDDLVFKFSHDNETYIVRKSYTNWVTSPTDGSSVYSGSELNATDTNVVSMVYYSIWSYSSTSGLYSKQYNITWGGLAVNCFNESDASQNLTFDLFVTNEEGTETYVDYDLTNTYYIDVDDLPTGNHTVVQISSSGYHTRYYYMDLFPNAFYELDAYLPIKDPTGGGGGWGDDNESYALLYLFTVVNYYSDPVDGAKATVQRYIPEEDSYRPVTTLYTDASGQCSLYLLPENIYKIKIEATGYNTEYVDFTPDPEIRVHTFRLDFVDISGDEQTEEVLDGISFTVEPNNHYWNDEFTIYYNITSSDNRLEWFRASFYVWNSTELNWDLLYTENNSASPSGGSIDYFVENNTGKYKMDAFFKKENFAEYEIIQTGSTIWFISWGGFDTDLTAGIPSFVWLIVALILTAILMGFFMPIAGLGTGYIGIGFLGFCMILKPDLILADGTTGWMILAIVTIVYSLGLFLWSRL